MALVDGGEFASRFFRLSAELRSARFDEERRSGSSDKGDNGDVEEAIHERFFARDEEALLEDYTEDDEASALGKLAKIARGALRGAAAPDLNPFKKGSNMDATTLKHFLKVCLRITLTPAELAALMGVLDQTRRRPRRWRRIFDLFPQDRRIEHDDDEKKKAWLDNASRSRKSGY